MAEIIAVKTSINKVQLRLINLDESWSGGTRTATWYLGYPNGGRPTSTYFDKWAPGEDILNESPTGGDVEFSNLESGTMYYVLCEVYHESELLAEIDGEFVTNEESLWTLWGEEQVDTAMEEYDYNWFLEPANIHRWTFVPSKSGYVRIYTTGSVDTFGYVSGSTDMNSDYSAPLSVIASDDDSGEDYNFRIEMYVTEGTEYYIFVRGSSGSETGYVTLYITSPKDSLNAVAKWNWSASNGISSADVTYASYCAVVNEEPTTNFSHLVWNDMIDKVDEILTAKGLYWDSTYAGIYETKMHEGEDYYLYAYMFNSLRNNLDFAYDTGIERVESENANYPVEGWYFTHLADCMNACIDNL